MKPIALMATAMVFALCGCAELEITTTKSMPSGTTQTVAFMTDLRRDCSLIDVPQVRVVQNPDSGVLSIAQVDDFPLYRANSPFEQCDSARTTGVLHALSRLYWKRSIQLRRK
jgi:hypothetical protein